jgi:hypothetical protein
MFDHQTPFDLLEPSPAEPEPEPVSEVADLEWLPTGVMLAAALERVDRHQLSGNDRVEVLKARARMISHLQAQLHADVEAIGDALREVEWLEEEMEVFDATGLEISAALNMTRRAAEALTGQATALLRLPQVWEALDEGRIDLARARIIIDLTAHLLNDEASRVADAALEQAPDQTTGQLRARLARLVIATDPAAAKERYEQRLDERRVYCRPAEDGTAHLLGLYLPPDQANAAMRRLTHRAKQLKAKGDKRPIDQIRADLYLAILTGRHEDEAEGHRGVVDLRVDLTTLAGLDDNPAEIPGWGPVIADIARKVAHAQTRSTWRALATDPEDGQAVALVTTKRRPTAEQRRMVGAIDPECVFPTCRLDFASCDINHEIPWAEAQHTTVTELEPACRHHHVGLHQRGWKLKRLRPGVYQWTSPLGRIYINRSRSP